MSNLEKTVYQKGKPYLRVIAPEEMQPYNDYIFHTGSLRSAVEIFKKAKKFVGQLATEKKYTYDGPNISFRADLLNGHKLFIGDIPCPLHCWVEFDLIDKSIKTIVGQILEIA